MLFIIFQITMQNFKKFGVIEKNFNFGYSPTLTSNNSLPAKQTKHNLKSY